MSIQITIAGERLDLLPDRAVWLPSRRTLLVTDTHFGKSAVFRRAAIPIPLGDTERDLARLDNLLGHTGAEQLVVLGDFYHARSGRTEQVEHALELWRGSWADLDLVLVRGNHDLHAGDPPSDWGIRCVDEDRLGPFVLRHEPGGPVESGMFELAGHVHPSVRLRGPGGDSVRLPCFAFGQQAGLLPAFGSFTGTHPVRPRRRDRVFAIAGDEVVEISGR